MSHFLTGINFDHWILSALLLIPLAGAVLLMVLPARLARSVALVTTLVELVISLGMWVQFDPSVRHMAFEYQRAWIGVYGITFHVGADGISLMMVLLTTVLMPLAVLGSWVGITTRERGFYGMLLVLTTGMIGVFVALDLFLFYMFWEVMLIPMYFIIGIWGGKARLYATLKFFIYTMVGSLLMLVAILYLYFSAGRLGGGYSFDFTFILSHLPRLPLGTQMWLFGAFALAFAIKVPIFPFHTWLPDAHTEAPTAGSVILAGILLKMGTYGFIRFAIPLFPAVAFHPWVSKLVIALAVIGIVYGALVALVQPDFKRLVAYSSVSHLGFVMLGLWALTVQGTQGALLVMINHGISTGALFLLIGMLYERRHSRLIADFGGIAAVMPAFAALLTFVSLSSVGLPGTNGFIGEFLVLLGSFQTHPAAAAIATSAVIFAAAYLLWALKRILYGPLTSDENRHLTDLTGREYAILAPLVALILWLGFYPQPVLRRTEPSVKAYLNWVNYQRALPLPTVVERPAAENDGGGR
ncbi:MAG TPA: NADH-quinone oxidoreductase subunit M [Gemmatimonadales bacterium]|jgi:NADH-quinone oxidoreductase subunit M